MNFAFSSKVAIWFAALLLPLLTANTIEAAGPIYHEADGVVVMEMENTMSQPGQWIKIDPGHPNYVEGATGSGHIEFTGNTVAGGDPNSPLDYTFVIHQAGNYSLYLRGRKRLAGAEWDKCNDVYVRMAGNFTSGNPDYKTEVLRMDTKQYLPSPKKDNGAETWAWSSQLDGNGVHHKPTIYSFRAGETYRLTISGRSQRYNLDRIVLRHENVAKSKALDPKLPESTTNAEDLSSNRDEVDVMQWNAIDDFKNLGRGTLRYYRDKKFDALAIDATNKSVREKFVRASRKFDGKSGRYLVRLTTLTEEDGESTYRLLIDGKEVGSVINPHIGQGSSADLQPHQHDFDSIEIKKGDTVSIESNTHSNGEIPEDGGFAWSRGRWRAIKFMPSDSVAKFDRSKDVLIAQFDSKPDADDVMAQAALACMLQHDDLEGVDFFAVAGAIGNQSGKYIDTRSLFELGFGREKYRWTDAEQDWEASVTRVKNKAKLTLEAGGTVWVAEAGQSDITADWVAALIKDGISPATIKESVIVVQHSQWNEDHSASDDLQYVQAHTTYRAIDDGNADSGDYSSRQSRGPQTPSYVSESVSWLRKATSASNPNTAARELWKEADRIIRESGFKARYSIIPGGGVDFSDCVENWWIFGVGASADNVASFWDRYVVNSNQS